jgi:CheY-like chemotaxis protein
MLEEIINFGKPARTSDLDVTSLAHLLEFLQDELEMDVDSMKSLNLCAKHQKRIADDILQISKLSLNLVSLSETPFEPLEETKGAIRMLERSASAKGIDITFCLGEQYKELKVDWVKADPIRFTQVLVNFISNAIRFTENAPTRNIEITLEASEELPDLPNSLIETSGIQQGSTVDDENPMFLVVSVKDTGVGLTPEERGNLFQKFRQASPKTYSQYGGSGLGLFISKALVEVQGGRISLQSEKGKGTTVSFYIRCSRSAAPPETPRLSRQQSRRWIKSRRDPDSPTTVPLNILVVEDDMVWPLKPSLIVQINQKVLTRQLQLLGHHAAVASNGLECLKQLEKDGDNFDLILMDIEMPVLNGFEATKEIRRREATGELPGHTPIIAVSGNARSEYVEKGIFHLCHN